LTITAEETTNAKLHNSAQHQQNMSEWHTVRLHKDTMAKIHRLGRFKESYSEVIDRVASEALGLTLPPEEGSW
jgi:hypothetical protein